MWKREKEAEVVSAWCMPSTWLNLPLHDVILSRLIFQYLPINKVGLHAFVEQQVIIVCVLRARPYAHLMDEQIEAKGS